MARIADTGKTDNERTDSAETNYFCCSSLKQTHAKFKKEKCTYTESSVLRTGLLLTAV